MSIQSSRKNFKVQSGGKNGGSGSVQSIKQGEKISSASAASSPKIRQHFAAFNQHGDTYPSHRYLLQCNSSGTRLVIRQQSASESSQENKEWHLEPALSTALRKTATHASQLYTIQTSDSLNDMNQYVFCISGDGNTVIIRDADETGTLLTKDTESKANILDDDYSQNT
ncbi:hypothetical protein D5R81_02830 [Parashewanella spongiae]|uniref:Uncharacterized protein n=2 Tax=Parashewanella spongiae TaxID=342950 RepID=A0A3A6U4G3_9GAMM|nr:hypothetical protein D5R81_02830 [Parashewanella spongiae]